MQQSSALGTTDSSLRISQNLEGLGLRLPLTLAPRSLTDRATNEALIDVVYPQVNASENTERANPRLPSERASELISSATIMILTLPILRCSIASTAIKWNVRRLFKMTFDKS